MCHHQGHNHTKNPERIVPNGVIAIAVDLNRSFFSEGQVRLTYAGTAGANYALDRPPSLTTRLAATGHQFRRAEWCGRNHQYTGPGRKKFLA